MQQLNSQLSATSEFVFLTVERKVPTGICRITALQLNADSPSGYGAPERQTEINTSTLCIIKEGPLSDITAFTFRVFSCYTPVTMCTVY